MEKIRLRVKARKYNFFNVMFRNSVRIWSIGYLIFTSFPKLAKQIKAADGKCVDIEISMKVVK